MATVVTIGNVCTKEGLTNLNGHLAKNSYIVGYAPTQHDATVFSKLSNAPNQDQYPHVARWYRHIKSYVAAESKKWPSVSSVTVVVDAGAAEAKATDEDFDLFGNSRSCVGKFQFMVILR